MTLATAILLFVIGAIVASFAGVIVARLHTGTGFSSGRSRCDACGTQLSILSLVPIVSFSVLRGRAHCCDARLSLIAPFSEVLLGALFALSYLMIDLTPALGLFLVALTLLFILVLYDLRHQILPPPFLGAFVLAAVAAGYLLYPRFSSVLLTAFLIAAFLFLIHILSRGRAMGLSDAPLAFGLTVLTGPAALPGFVFSFWIGALIGIAVLFGRPHGSKMGVEVPFAPFLAAGFLLAYFTQWNPFLPFILPF